MARQATLSPGCAGDGWLRCWWRCSACGPARPRQARTTSTRAARRARTASTGRGSSIPASTTATGTSDGELPRAHASGPSRAPASPRRTSPARASTSRRRPARLLDRMVIWRTGYRFNSTGQGQGPWAVGGYRGDSTVIGGPLFGETCNIPPGQLHCDLPYRGDARVEHDLETNEVLYSVVLLPRAGLRDGERSGLPVRPGQHRRLDRHGARRAAARRRRPRPADASRAAHVDDAPLSFGASDPVGDPPGARAGRRRAGARVLAGVRLHARRAVRPGAGAGRAARRAVPTARTRSTVEATDTAGNVARADRTRDGRPQPAARSRSCRRRGRRRIVVAAPDAGSGTAGGTIEARRRGSRRFRALPTRLRGRAARRAAAARVAARA